MPSAALLVVVLTSAGVGQAAQSGAAIDAGVDPPHRGVGRALPYVDVLRFASRRASTLGDEADAHAALVELVSRGVLEPQNGPEDIADLRSGYAAAPSEDNDSSEASVTYTLSSMDVALRPCVAAALRQLVQHHPQLLEALDAHAVRMQSAGERAQVERDRAVLLEESHKVSRL